MLHYGTVQEFYDYCEARGIELPGTMADDEEAARALLVASEWIDTGYRDLFPGEKMLFRAQVREWPRRNAFDDRNHWIGNDIPQEVINATYEAAAIHANSPGSLSVNFTPSKYKSISVDGAVSIEFQTFESAIEAQTEFLNVKRVLAPILSGTFGRASRVSGLSYRA